MGKIVRITLTHAVEGSFVISEPEGWKDAVLNWERHPDLHCVPESYKSAFSAYGSNGLQDGGIDWIKNVERVHGVDAKIDVLIEEAEEFSPFTELSKGTLPIQILVEVANFDHRLQFTFSPSSFWTTFLSKFDTPVNIQSPTDLYGNACTVLIPLVLPLTSQLLITNFSAVKERSSVLQSFNFGVVKYSPIGWDKIILDEIEITPNGYASYDIVIPTTIKSLYKSIVTPINFKIYACNLDATVGGGGTLTFNSYAPVTSHYKLCLLVNDLIIDTIIQTDFADYSVYELSTTISILKGDKISICFITDTDSTTDAGRLIIIGTDVSTVGQDITDSYFDLTLTNPPIPPPANVAGDNFITISENTEYEETTTPAFLIHDLGAAITERIVGQPNSFKSNYLGRTNTLARTYPLNGCGSPNVAFQGLQARGYTLTEKPFSHSMKDYLLGGIKPIFNLGARYVKTNTEEYIQIEPSREFYPDRVSITLSNVKYITRAYEPTGFYNKFKVGYDKYEIQESSGLNIPQSYRILASILKTIGGTLEMMSSYIAGDLTIERIRRTTRQQSADYQYDNDVCIVAVRDTGTGFTPELSENYSSVTGLLNESTRYNKNLTPYRNFIRWLNIASNGLQSYLSSKFTFQSGTGNYDMASTRNDGGCAGDFGGAGLSEKQDIDVSSDFLYLPILYTINHVITSEQIQALRADPEAAILVSQTETDHIKFYIKTAEARPHDGNFTLVAWPKEFFDIKNVDNNSNEQENPNPPQSFIFDDTFPHPPFT
ncbi:MAG TPA: hypothetical protein VI146_08730 [Nitrososphaeraceae archaeon]